MNAKEHIVNLLTMHSLEQCTGKAQEPAPHTTVLSVPNMLGRGKRGEEEHTSGPLYEDREKATLTTPSKSACSNFYKGISKYLTASKAQTIVPRRIVSPEFSTLREGGEGDNT